MAEITVIIKSSGDGKHSVVVDTSISIAELKKRVEEATGVEADRQRLIYSGKVLKDNDTVESYNIKDGNALHLVKGPSKASTEAAAASSASESTTKAPTNATPSNISAGQPTFNPLAGLTDARYAGYNIPMPTLDQLGMNTDGMAMPSEDQMSQMMDSPMFQESMRSMLSNPQMLDYLIEQSPQLRSMGPAAREMLQSDYVRNMLTNPQAMRSMMEFQRAMGGGAGGAGGSTPGFGANAFGEGSFPAPGNPSTGEAASTAAPESNNNTNANANVNPFASMFGAGGMSPFGFGASPFSSAASATAAQPVQDTRPPEEVYATQLGQLNDMGFFDFEQNVRALRRSGGRVEGALEMLLNGSV